MRFYAEAGNCGVHRVGNDNNEAAPSDRPPLLVPAQMRPRPTVGTNAPEIIGGWVVDHIGTELAQTVPNN